MPRAKVDIEETAERLRPHSLAAGDAAYAEAYRTPEARAADAADAAHRIEAAALEARLDQWLFTVIAAPLIAWVRHPATERVRDDGCRWQSARECLRDVYGKLVGYRHARERSEGRSERTERTPMDDAHIERATAVLQRVTVEVGRRAVAMLIAYDVELYPPWQDVRTVPGTRAREVVTDRHGFPRSPVPSKPASGWAQARQLPPQSRLDVSTLSAPGAACRLVAEAFGSDEPEVRREVKAARRALERGLVEVEVADAKRWLIPERAR